MISETTTLDKFIVVGDRVLLKPKSTDNQTKSGLFLPPGVQEKEKIQSGYVLKAGPGYPIPNITDSDEPWKNTENVKYIPLQARVGDEVVYLQNAGFELEFNKEKYVIVPHSSVLLIIRDEGLFK